MSKANGGSHAQILRHHSPICCLRFLVSDENYILANSMNGNVSTTLTYFVKDKENSEEENNNHTNKNRNTHSVSFCLFKFLDLILLLFLIIIIIKDLPMGSSNVKMCTNLEIPK
jgi:hypothetical protein